MSSCLVIQHVAPERCFAIGDALENAGIDIDVCRVYADDRLPERLGDQFAGLVVMGGPMSATDDKGFATRADEIRLLAEALEIGLPALGVCLGAQLLAVAAGGRVFPGSKGPEIGWAPIQLTAAAADDPLFVTAPSDFTVLHWHGDTYETPAGAVHLATSERYPQQAFRTGANAWGLQFHLEVDESAVGEFLRVFGADAFAAGTTPAALRAATPGAVGVLARHRDELLGRFAAIVARRPPTLRDPVDELADLS